MIELVVLTCHVSLAVASCFPSEIVAGPTQARETRERVAQQDRSIPSLALAGCVGITGDGNPSMVSPSFRFLTILKGCVTNVFKGADKSLYAPGDKEGDSFSPGVPLVEICTGWVEGRCGFAFGMMVGSSLGRRASFVGARRGVDDLSGAVVCAAILCGFSTGALILGA